MGLAYPLMSNFNGGEVSPLVYARPDLKRYSNGVETMENMVPLIQGPATRRPGTLYKANTKVTTDVKFIPFVFSDDDAFILELGNLYMRFYYNRAQVLSSGTPYEIVTPYTTADLEGLSFVQSADVMYIVHPSHAPRKLERAALTSWSLNTVVFDDGPYLAVNNTAITLTPSHKTGTGVTLTASAALFASSDVGRTVRIFNGSPAVWGWARITGFTSSTVVTIDILQEFGAASATVDWRLSVWSSALGWPETVALVEDRLVLAGGPAAPFRVDFSKTGDYENFSPTEDDGQVVDDNAITINLIGGNGAAGRVDKVKWVIGDDKGVLIGTTAGEWLIRGETASAPLTPAGIQSRQITSVGSNETSPARVGNAVMHIQRGGRKVRQLAYAFEIDGFRSEDISLLSEHMFKAGVKDMAYQQEPYSILWIVNDDGGLVSLTYDREQQVAGFARHTLGGTNAQVISAAAIPSPTGEVDDLWLCVRRTVGGSTVQTVELMSEFNTNFASATEVYFVDCGVYETSGTAFSSVSGLTHLNGETLAVLAGGATAPDVVVSGGSVTLTRSVTAAAVGYPYNSRIKTLRVEAGVEGTAQGKIKRIQKILARFHQTIGAKFGRDFVTMDRVFFRSSADAMDTALPLFSGDKEVFFAGSYDRDGYICLEQTDPLPLTVLGMFPELVTNA